MRLSFEGFEVDLDSGQLVLAGRPIALERRAFEMLAYLAAHPNRLVSKDELLSEVWQARALSDGAVMNAATKLRKAFGQAAGASEPIETVRGRGYRLHALALQAANPAAPALSDPFVGRAQLFAVLDQSLERARAGQAQVVVLTGDPGIGKTRALDELSKRARACGFSVWEGTAYDGGGAPAYWPWIEVLRSAHADLSRAMFRQHIAGASAALARLVPELLEADGDDAADAGATRFRLFDDLTRFVGAASASAPRLIALDDLHWADAGTIELAAFAARALKKRSVMLVVALRGRTFEAGDVRAELLARLLRLATHITLPGLAEPEVAQLVAALAPAHVSSGGRVFERSQGNPFFARQLIELLAQPGGPTAELPQAVRDLLALRTATLEPATQAALRVAAVIGHELDIAVLASALDTDNAQALAAIEPALRRGVIERVAGSDQRFAFSHVLQRDVIYANLTLVLRGALHAKLAQVLERRVPGADAQVLGELARHHLLAVPCDLAACVRYAERAAASAREALGFEAAAQLLERACDKLASEAGDPRLRCELLLALGQDHFCVGNVRQAWQALQLGAAIADQLNAPDLIAHFACRLASWLELGGGDEHEVRARVDRALALIGDGDRDLRAALLAHRAEINFELPTLERLRLLDEAAALAAPRNTPRVALEIALCRAGLRDPTQLDEAKRALAHYRAVAHEQRGLLAAPQRLLHDFAAELGEYVRALTACELHAADAAIERCRVIAQHSQVAAVALGVELMIAGRALADGRLDDLAAGVERLREGSSLAGGFSLVWASYALRLVEARDGFENLAGFAGDPPAGLDQLRPAQQMNARLWLARLNAKLGAHDKARSLLASISNEQLARMPVRYGDLGLLCFLAEIYCELGEKAGAATLYEQLAPFAERNAVGLAFEYNGAVAHYLGMLAALLQQPARAAQHFELAERINRRLSMPLQAALSAQLRSELASRT